MNRLRTLVWLLLALLFGAFSGASRLLTRQNRQLRTSEERFRSLVQNSVDVNMIIAADGTIVYESPAAQRVLGVTGDRTGHQGFDGIHEDAVDFGEIFGTGSCELERGRFRKLRQLRGRGSGRLGGGPERRVPGENRYREQRAQGHVEPTSRRCENPRTRR